MDQVKFVEDSSRPYHFKFCKACLLQILLGPFLSTLTHIFFSVIEQMISEICLKINIYNYRLSEKRFFEVNKKIPDPTSFLLTIDNCLFCG